MPDTLVDPDQDKKKDPNPGQEHYDREFNSMVNAGSLGEDPESSVNAARDAEHEGATPKQSDAGEGGLAKGFDGGSGKKKDKDDDEAGLASGFDDDDDKPRRFRLRNLRSFASAARGLSNKKLVVAGIVGLSITGLVVAGFLALLPFKLENIMQNFYKAGFGRYQVDMTGRSNVWLAKYMELRMAEVDDPSLAPKDRDNILFKADSVKTNHPLTDWYRTLRSSKFEQEVFEKEGITFTSVAKKVGNHTEFRTGIVSIKGEGDLTFHVTPGEEQAILKGDVNGFNNRLKDFIEVKTFDTNKEARAALKDLTAKYLPGWWNALKRFHLRHDIMNKIGLRKWSFFEEKRTNTKYKIADLRNKLIIQAFPASSKSGKFIQCIFGIGDCKAGEDDADPANSELPVDPDGKPKEPDQTVTCPETGCTDGSTAGEALGDGSAEAELGKVGLATSDFINKFVKSFISHAGLLSMLDSLSRFDQSLHNHSLTKIIVESKKEFSIGLFTTFATAADQLHTGHADSNEVNQLMEGFANPTDSEGWESVINPSSTDGSAFADGTQFTAAKDKQEFCSQKHQSEIDNANYGEADQEFQWLCPKYQVGGATRGSELEDAWDEGPGKVLHPILAAYHKATGGIFGFFNSLIGAITGPIIDGFLSITGLKGDINHVVAWVATKALEFAGGGPMVNDSTPSGQVSNVALEGAASLAETSMREQGAAATTKQTRALATKNYYAYEATQNTSFADRYFSLNNPQSLLSRQLLALSEISPSKIGNYIMNTFAAGLSSPLRMISPPAHAATDDPYAAANFAAINTYDFPPQCLNSDPLTMTPADATNADDLGYFKPDELNWDLMSNKEEWYKALYDHVGNDESKAIQVYNCALFDNTVRGSIGGLYGAPGVDAVTD